MSTSEADHLGRLFRCERFAGQFPLGMPIRACLRRQLDRQVAMDGTGKQRPPAEWPPCKPFCAVECLLGRQHLEEARAAGIPAETCLRCGSAQVGSGSAAPCAGCEPDAKAVPSGHLPAPAGPAASSRLWTGEVPDVPIGGPGGHRSERLPRPPSASRLEAMEALAAERRHEFAQEQDHQEPDQPAEEEAMACGKCGSKTVHKGWCENRPGGPMKGAAGKKPEEKAPGGAQAGGVKPAKEAKVTPLRPAAPRRAAGRLENPPELTTAPLDELLRQRALATALISAVDGELRRRQSEIAKALGQALRAAEG